MPTGPGASPGTGSGAPCACDYRPVPGRLRRLAGCGLVLVLGLGAPAASVAAEALYLTWDNCALDGGLSSITRPCDTESGSEVLYVAFSLGQPVDQVLGIETVVDIQSEASTLPNWWHFEAGGPSLPAGCHQGALTASRSFAAGQACVDPWAGTTGDALVQDFTPGAPRGAASQARIRATAFIVSPDPPLTLDAAHQYYGLKLILSNQGTALCTGCDKPACLVLNSIWLKRLPGATGGDVLLTTPGPGDANWARWQGTSGDCTAVPVRRSTWGQVKSLYRH